MLRTKENRSGRRFVSVRVKIPLLVATALLLTYGVVGAVNQVIQQRRYETLRAEANSRDVRQLQGVLEASGRRLERFAEFLPALQDLQRAIALGNRDLAERALAGAGSEIGFGLDLDLLQIYDPMGTLVAEHRTGWGQRERAPWWLARELKKALQREEGRSLLVCTPHCLQYAFVPLLIAGKTSVAVVAQSVAQTLIEFRRITGTNVALLTPAIAGDDPQNPYGRYLVDLEAMPDTGNMENVLLEALGEGLLVGQVPALRRIEYQGRHFDVIAPSVEHLATYGRGFFVLMRDETATVAAVNMAVRESWGIALLGLLATAAMLTGSAWRGVSRIHRAGRVLPMLGERKYQQVRTQVQASSRAWFADEFDGLDDSIGFLARRLEALDAQVAKHTSELSENLDELARERDLITSLFNAAPTVVLTLDSKLNILLHNPLMEEMTGLDSHGIQQHSFEELCLPKQQENADVLGALTELASGGRARFEHEGTLTGPDGVVHALIWWHVPLHRGQGGASILAVGVDMTQQRRAETRADWLSVHDPLTGLFNLDRFRAACAGIVSEPGAGALIVLNVDNFKYLNERGGHRTGDRVLTELAHAILGALPAGAHAGRIGGNEFAVLFPAVTAETAESLAARLVNQAGRLQVFDDGGAYRISVSCGIALYPEHGASVEELLGNALAALAEARENGPGGWLTFSASVVMRERMRHTGAMLDRLRRALAEHRLVLFYQPIVDLRTMHVVRHEALVRMRADDDSRLLAPGEFIPIAERHGLIVQLDQWVLDTAIKALGQAPTHTGLSVNLSGPSLRDSSLPLRVQAALGRAGIAPQRLVFEVTETAAVQDMLVAQEVIERLRAAGCRFALDDFGVGFSSMSYLRELPVDFVKIDGSFIHDIADRPEDQLLVHAIHSLAQGLGKKTVAEFVSSARTLEFVRRAGIDYGQGYHLGKPAPDFVLTGETPIAGLPPAARHPTS